MYQEESFKTDKVIYAHTRSDEAGMEYKMHSHNSYEIYYIITGHVEYHVEGRVYIPKPGSLVVTAPGTFHGVRVLDGQDYHRIRLHFVSELLGEKERGMLLAPFDAGWCFYEEQFQLEWYFHALEECGTYGKDLQNIAISARVISILTKIFAIYQENSEVPAKAVYQAREIIHYINEHLAEPLTLEGIAEAFYMSKNHLTAVFKRATGTTVARYILYKRMTIVRAELTAGIPAAEAAAKAGFGDYSSFFRAYKKMFGCAPTDKNAMQLPDMDKSRAF